MRYLILMVTIGIAIAACKSKQDQYSRSYAFIKDFMVEARIPETDVIYFYCSRPKTQFPNVYCFDSNGVQLASPPQCFQYIDDYITLLNDSIMPVNKNGGNLGSYLDSMVIVDINDKQVGRADVTGYDNYLFIDFVALPLPGLQETLHRAKMAVGKSRKRIKLFLVHAISEHNRQYLRKNKADADADANRR